MTTFASRDQLPPLPASPYVIGIESGSPVHAVTHQAAQQAVWNGDNDCHRVHTYATCGADVVLARRWGPFARGEKHVDQRRVCAHCAWTVALDTPAYPPATGELLAFGALDAELALITPTGAELEALTLVVPDPLVARKTSGAILKARADDRDHDADDEYWPRLLARVTDHQPALLMDEGCVEDACDHDTKTECYGEQPTVACMACSILAGPEAGEWEGQVEIAVPAPCSVLVALSGRYL